MGKLTYVLMVLVTISFLASSFSSLYGVSSVGQETLSFIFDRNSLDTPNPTWNGTFDNKFSKSVSQSEAGETNAFMGFIDGLKKIFTWVINILGLGFSVFNLLYKLGMPLFIASLIGLPVAIAFYVSLLAVVRGYDI